MALPDDAFDFMQSLLTGNSPSGFEAELQNLWVERTTPFCDRCSKDVTGNAIGVRNPDAPFKVMLAGHMDEIGLMVMNITDDGMLEILPIGSFSPDIAPGTPVLVLTAGKTVNGVVGKPAVYPGDEKKEKVKIHDLWVDIGTSSRDEAETLVSAGDPIVMASTFRPLAGDRYLAKGVDDRIGAFICSEVLRLLAEREVKVGVWSVATVQEEVGSRGAHTSCHAIDPTVGIAIDVCHTSDFPTTEKKRVGDVRLGGGPVLVHGCNTNPPLGQMLREVAEEGQIPYQIAPTPMPTWTDASVLQIKRSGTATGLVKIPLRYMHSPGEIFSASDVSNAIRLLVEFTASLDGTENFIP